jgi:alcohol dehydrogenase class IV
MAYNERASHERIQRLTGALREHIEAGEEPSGKTPTIYTWLDSLCSRLGIPQSLASIGITEKDLPRMIGECVESYPRPNNPVPFDETTLNDLYKYMLEGDLAGCLKAFGTN